MSSVVFQESLSGLQEIDVSVHNNLINHQSNHRATDIAYVYTSLYITISILFCSRINSYRYIPLADSEGGGRDVRLPPPPKKKNKHKKNKWRRKKTEREHNSTLRSPCRISSPPYTKSWIRPCIQYFIE